MKKEINELRKVGMFKLHLDKSDEFITELAIERAISKQEQARYNFGYVQITDHLIKYFKLDHLCSHIMRSHKLGYDLQAPLILMLVERLNIPCSKLANYNNQHELGLIEVSSLQSYKNNKL